MKFIADFHIHSKYSRATAKNLDFENLYINAQVKGITVLGTADFTHPAWWQEIQDKLIPAEDGLFELKPEIARACDERVPPSCRAPVRFMLVTEISNIYKKQDRTRKNHNLVFMPGMESAARFNRKMDEVGNIQSDGRPILGLDARNLLEIVLESDDDAFLVPAHIWTPWFSLLGSKSGFDSVQACFEDLTPHIFALETGLSSDPPMNWRVSALDGYTLISNSDAHSPSKLGREANRFDCDLGYGAMQTAMQTADPQRFRGTIEFYPEEGKYHVDGHRKCGFQSDPSETRRLSGICPVCGKPLTIGVLNRVEELADRDGGQPPPGSSPYRNLIPLEHVLSEVLQVGANSKKVRRAYHRLIHDHGSEFDILCRTPAQALSASNIPLLDEALTRMRDGRVNFTPGYDGEFGRVCIFDPSEREHLQGQRSLFDIPAEVRPKKTKATAPSPEGRLMPDIVPQKQPEEATPPPLFPEPQADGTQLNAEQKAAVDHPCGPLIISAGPGTGKTRTITCRVAHLMRHGGVAARHILAVTFTRKAAEEMRHRLQTLLPPGSDLPLVATFHGFCRQLLDERHEDKVLTVIDDAGRRVILADAVEMVRHDGGDIDLPLEALLKWIIEAKQQLRGPSDDLGGVAPEADLPRFRAVYDRYRQLMTMQALIDFEDLIFQTVRSLENDPDWKNRMRKRFTHIFVDEFQDINGGQYRLLRALAPPEAQLCVIGDPDQAIYGFRGSDVRYFRRFSEDYRPVKSIRLNRNYRCTQTILEAACQVIQSADADPAQDSPAQGAFSGIKGFQSVTLMETPSPRAEAVAIGRTIEEMVGGTGFHSMDFDKLDSGSTAPERSFGDFAVLCRTGDQVQAVARQLTDGGIPCQWVSRRILERPVVSKWLAAYRVATHQGGFAELIHLTDLGPTGISRETLGLFKRWAYARQLPLAKALHSVHRLPIAHMSTTRQKRLVSWVRFLERLQEACAGKRVFEALTHIVDNTPLSSKLEDDDIDCMAELAAPHGTDPRAFCAALAGQRDTDLYRPGVEKVSVMTLHASKGLEFPVVFIAGCEVDLMPFRRPGQERVNTEEERRLFYVGMTRARRRLILTWSRRRTLFGQTHTQRISPFIQAIDPSIRKDVVSPQASRKPRQEQLSLF
jgi:DNA helicase II / ATP-dependent DNA helicase PcrA